MTRRCVPWLAGALTAAAMAMGGCQEGMYLAWLFQPPQKVEAAFKVPKDKKILVLVEDRLHPADEVVKAELADRIGRKLVEKKIAGSTIPYDRVQALAAQPDYREMRIDKVGKQLGADLVLYVSIESYQLKEHPFSPYWQGQLAVSVWVVDVQTEFRLWPTDRPKGSGFVLEPVLAKPVEDPSPSYGEQVARAMAEEMATRVVQLFHDRWVSPQDEEPDKKVDPRDFTR